MSPRGEDECHSKSRFWCGTLNNPTDVDCVRMESLYSPLASGESDDLTYIVIGDECGSSGTKHFQFYVEFRREKRFSAVKKLFPGAHLELRRGTALQASDYCKKEDHQPIEFGCLSLPAPGARTDLDGVREAIRRGESELSIADSYFSRWIVYRRSFSAYRSLVTVRRTWETKVVLLVGTTGTGKSRFVHSLGQPLYIAVDNTLLWFDGYSSECDVLLDDFDGAGASLTFLLRLLDRYNMDVPVKGGFVPWVPRRVFITSNTDPEAWFPSSPEAHMRALRRRISRIVVIQEPLSFNVVDARTSDVRLVDLYD